MAIKVDAISCKLHTDADPYSPASWCLLMGHALGKGECVCVGGGRGGWEEGNLSLEGLCRLSFSLGGDNFLSLDFSLVGVPPFLSLDLSEAGACSRGFSSTCLPLVAMSSPSSTLMALEGDRVRLQV